MNDNPPAFGGDHHAVRKLLIVDDHALLATATELFAQTIGFDTMTLNRSDVATEAFLSYHPDIVILDVMLPGKDGISILHEILQTGTQARIILTSGMPDISQRLAARVPSAVPPQVTVLRKPYSLDDLVGVLGANHPQGAQHAAADAGGAF